jgi:hypothetical protein
VPGGFLFLGSAGKMIERLGSRAGGFTSHYNSDDLLSSSDAGFGRWKTSPHRTFPYVPFPKSINRLIGGHRSRDQPPVVSGSRESGSKRASGGSTASLEDWVWAAFYLGDTIGRSPLSTFSS